MTQFLEEGPIPSLPPIDEAPSVHTSEELRQRWRSLMGSGGFDQHSLWVIWFDREGRQLPVVVPIDDLPDTIDASMLRNLMWVLNSVAEQGACSVALLLSRPGSSMISDRDRSRTNAILSGVSEVRERDEFDLALWPMHLATPNCVRTLTADDLS